MRSTILVCLVLSSTSFARGELPATLDLSGADWRLHEDADGKGEEHRMFDVDASTSGWIPATVPGNIQADLESAHQLKPLWYGAGDPRMAEVARKDWWYRKDFTVPESFKGKRLTLVFDGVDHECDVWLNGRRLGRNAGMFRRFEFDVSDAVQPGRKNQLAVCIARIPEELVAVMTSSDASGGVKVGPAIVATLHRLKELKSPTNCAWDWAVAVWTLGIWKDVRIEATGPARIEWVRVQIPLTDNYRRAKVKTQLEVDSIAEMPAKAVFRVWRLNESEVCATTAINVALKKGPNKVQAELPLENPALWWPNGQGEQPLYELESTLTAADNAAGSTTGPLDRRATRFGVREVRWEQCPGSPADFINPLNLVVNGRPVRQMGSNLIPPDSLFGRIMQRGPRLLELARESGINCLRLWGGGVILPEEMYDRADELGIMLLQEFPLANNIPETDAVMLSNFEFTITNIVKQTRNHPCIVEWTGGNEMPWQNGDKHPALQLLEKIVREEDGRIFRATEPAQGSGPHGTYTYVYHTEPAPELSWLGAGNVSMYQRYNTAVQMRISEFGTNSPANLEVWHREIPPSSQWPLDNLEDEILIRKNVFHGAMLPRNWLHKELTERIFGKCDRLPMLVEAGQFLGGEGLRYAMDALRRKGPALGGGFMSWNYNEPWPNGAGSYMIDYDGRPLMNYDFVRQALAPVSLTLKYDSLLFDPVVGVAAELFLCSDAPAVENVKWRWLARDRRGETFARGEGTATIAPEEVKNLAKLELKPPKNTSNGPVFVELQLTDNTGKLLTERLHIFGSTARGSLGGLLKNSGPDKDDDDSTNPQNADRPDNPANLAFVGNGAKPATASSARPEPIHQPAGLNDGKYGNDHSWIGMTPKSWFQIDLGKPATVARFKLGRDRVGSLPDRSVDSLKIETSLDGQSWKTVFEKSGITKLLGFGPTKTMTIDIPPVEARFIKATVDPKNSTGGEMVCIDEFEVYAPSKELPAALPAVTFKDNRPELWRPVRRTALQVETRPDRMEGDREVLELIVKNTGPMTALFCEPHPLIAYRTDLFIDNNHCFIPPGESRTILIKASKTPRGGLSLAETGWRISCWNADDVVIEPSDDVLLAVGRRDQMCREFLGYFDVCKADEVKSATLKGTRPDAAKLPYLLDNKKLVRFEFSLSDAQAKRPARLRIHSADQSKAPVAMVHVTVNGRPFDQTLPTGIALQKDDPSHLAFQATAEFKIPADALQESENVVEVRVKNDGWFTWDAMELIAMLSADAPAADKDR